MVILFIYLAWALRAPGIGREQEVILTPGHEPLLLDMLNALVVPTSLLMSWDLRRKGDAH